MEDQNVSWGEAYVIYRNFPDVLNGQLYEFIEALGLESKQEEAIKRMIQRMIWRHVNEDGVLISPETHSKIRNKYYEDKEKNKGSFPEVSVTI